MQNLGKTVTKPRKRDKLIGWAKKYPQAKPKKQKDKPKAYWAKGLYTPKLCKSNWWQFLEEKSASLCPLLSILLE